MDDKDLMQFINLCNLIQEEVFKNKLNKGFNTTNIPLEFCYLSGELAEAFDSRKKKKSDLDQELADIAIYLFGLSSILDIDLGEAIVKKMNINKNRIYKNIDGVNIKE